MPSTVLNANLAAALRAHAFYPAMFYITLVYFPKILSANDYALCSPRSL